MPSKSEGKIQNEKCQKILCTGFPFCLGTDLTLWKSCPVDTMFWGGIFGRYISLSIDYFPAWYGFKLIHLIENDSKSDHRCSAKGVNSDSLLSKNFPCDENPAILHLCGSNDLSQVVWQRSILQVQAWIMDISLLQPCMREWLTLLSPLIYLCFCIFVHIHISLTDNHIWNISLILL